MTDTLYGIACPTWCAGDHLPIVGDPEMVREYHQQHADELAGSDLPIDEYVIHSCRLSPDGSGMTLDMLALSAHPASEVGDESAGVAVWVADEGPQSAEGLREWARMLDAAADTLEAAQRG